MRQNNRKVGNEKEDMAVKYLISLGYVILERNYRCKHGEIDIIALDGEYIAFIEVKYRLSTISGMPEEAVNSYKQIKIQKCAQYFLYNNQKYYNYQMRFDVIAITSEKLRNIKNAFDFSLYGYF